MTLLALLEVMDKEPSVPGMWTWGLAMGVGGYLAARRWPWTAALPMLLAAAGTWAVVLEIQDPWVGPALLHEAGPSYPWHVAASGLLGFALPLAGAASGLRLRFTRPHAFP